MNRPATYASAAGADLCVAGRRRSEATDDGRLTTDLPSHFTSHVSRLTPHASPSAFTLVELLLVMAIMIATISVAAPTLANFFRGRSLDSEARRLLALTHAGQSRAVYEGIPMMLWIDAERREYGLREEAGWMDRDPKAVDFALDKDLQFELLRGSNPKPSTVASTVPSEAQRRANPRGLPEIKFLTDGSIDESSPAVVRLFDRDSTSRYLVLATNRANYEIRSEYNQ